MINKLYTAGIENPRRLVSKLISHYTGENFEKIYLTPQNITGELHERLTKDVQRLIEGEPLSKIIEQKEFYGRIFRTTRHTLDPRPDSECIITLALNHLPSNARILDLGTGTGCLALTLLVERSDAQAVGVDICPHALDVALYNAQQLGVGKRFKQLHSHWLTDVTGVFDVIIANPPYIDYTEEVSLGAHYDPPLALFAEKNGLAAYLEILPKLHNHMHPKTNVFFEMGHLQAEELSHLVKQDGLHVRHIIQDLEKRDRGLWVSY